jgi:uncharacterized protein
MGHRDSPARRGGADRIFSADGRTPQPVAERAHLSVQSTEKRPGVIARALLLLLRVYQTYLSSMSFSSCRFYPSCSHYAGEAVQRFGARRGVWLTLKRLARCQPFSRGGFDPIPEIDRRAPVSSRSENRFASDAQQTNVSYHDANLLQADGSYQGTALAVPYSSLTSGVLTPEGSSHSSHVRATRGQEFAQ